MAKCRTCKFFIGDKRGGECHRNPPVGVIAPSRDALGNPGIAPSSFFPPVTTETWCGEFVDAMPDVSGVDIGAAVRAATQGGA